jgi:hypothetical protein
MTTTPDFRALCAELLEVIEGEYEGTGLCYELRHRASAALATPPPEPPTDEELNRLRYYEFSTSTGHGESVDVLGFARAVLERWGHR